MAKGKKVETETGYAILNEDGTMKLTNSGYVQHITAESVEAAWSGANKLPVSPDIIQEMKDDGLEGDELEEEMAEYAPSYDGEYWDFGEELHIIPSKKEFK